MVKLTKRKGFNFFRSYYDVYNELKDTDKIAFIDALLDRQFLGIKPDNLTGMAKFAYISQTNSIDSQVRGYNDKCKSLNKPLLGENKTPTVPPTYGGELTPTQQVQEKEKEEEEVQDVCDKNSFYQNNEPGKKQFLNDWNTLRLKHLKKPSYASSLKGFDYEDSFKEHSIDKIKKAMVGLFKQKRMPDGIEKMRLTPKHLLKETYIEEYSQAFIELNDQMYGTDAKPKNNYHTI